MADCSYYRCIQERRFIKRELQKWCKDMVYIVGKCSELKFKFLGKNFLPSWTQYLRKLPCHFPPLISPSPFQPPRQNIAKKNTRKLPVASNYIFNFVVHLFPANFVSSHSVVLGCCAEFVAAKTCCRK